MKSTISVAALILSACILDAQSSGVRLAHRYSFTANANDSAGTANGELVGGATIAGGAVNLDGASGYVNFPNGIVSGLSNVTFEVWLMDNGSGTWSRIFDFGNNTGGEDAVGSGTQYLFITPQSGGGNLRTAITLNGGGAEEQNNAAARLPIGSLEQVVWTIDAAAQIGRLYVNGSLEAESTSATLNPSTLGDTVNNWLGRSQFSADPYLSASITEFRIYDGALSDTDVQRSYAAGPDTVISDGPVSLARQPQSQTVTELFPATFNLEYEGSEPVAIQWFRNTSPIPGATNSTYFIPSVPLTNNGANFWASLTNSYTNHTFTVSTTNATLMVNADTTSPALVRAESLFPDQVLVSFSEGVRADTATNKANYSISSANGPLAITTVQFDDSASNVILTTAPQTLDRSYTLTVNSIRDLASAANIIATNSETGFVALSYQTCDIGNPATTGTLTPVTGGFDLTSGGKGISGTADQFSFAYRNVTNDFDMQVRVADLAFSGTWARAGLMARDGLDTNSIFAAAFATPGPAGCHFESRGTAGGNTTMAGSFPVNYPDTWLRLRRVENVFDSFASLDGRTWDYLGSTTVSMPPVIQVGYAVTAANTSQTTTAQFRDEASGNGTIVTNETLPFEPLGPCSRRTDLVISEIMYHPRSSWEQGAGDLEYIELWNSGLITEDLTGHKLEGDIQYQFPDGTKLAPGQFLVIAKDPIAARNFYGVDCLGPYTNKLSNSGGTLRLLNEIGGILLQVQYGTKAPWPAAADGTGHSLVLSRPSYGENDPRAWSASDLIGGSPGRYESYGAEPARGVVINEFLAHTDLPQVDFIELFNTNRQPVNLSGARLSDDPATNKFRIPDGTMIPARGWVTFTETEMGFALSATGEKILLVNSNQTRVLDAVAFDGQANGVSFGRYPDGAPGLQPLSSVTENSANTHPLIQPLVINEIMYHPISDSDDDEYVEIYNRGATAVNLAGWEMQGGIGFTFPTNAIIGAGQYVVVAKNAANLRTRYSQLNVTNTFGDYSGKLSNSGERIALAMPDDIIRTNTSGIVSTDVFYITVDEVTYSDGGRWGQWSDGGGSSLELTDPHSDNRLAANWADSDETAKAPWTTIDETNVLENGMTFNDEAGNSTTMGAANRFEFFLQGAGEAIVDNLEFRNNGGVNLISNGDFASGSNGWLLGGVLRNSYAQFAVGVGNTLALHLVSTGHGDTGANKISRGLTSTATTGAPNTGTIRASVRWLKGSPYILLRTRGNWMEVSRRLNVPSNCGTPGLPNSRLVSNAGPAITDVSHNPVLPAAGQAVVVSARASDPDGVANVQLKYCVDPNTAYSTLNMTNDNGIFSATIPGQASGTLVAFVVTATDSLGASAQFPAEAPARECLVRWGETVIPGSIGTYRLWLTQSNINFWTGRERNANDPIDATFVYGNSRVIYNAETMYSGSPFHTPAYNGPLAEIASDYEVNFSPDDAFLGTEAFVLTAYDVVSGNFFFNDDTAQVDLTGTWVARKLGIPYNYRRHIHVVMNGVHRGTIYDDAQQPNSDMLDEYYPNDTQRQLRKIESWFEFADDAQSQSSVYATIQRVNKSTGEIDPKRYRWNWRPRVGPNPDDWTSLTNLIAAVNDTTSPDYVGRVREWMDVRNFLGPVAVHHVVSSWDSYAYNRGKNMYAYKPDGKPWRLMMWDIELAMNAAQGGSSASDSIYQMFDKTLLNMIQGTPALNREYLQLVQDAVNGPLAPGVANTILDERYASFQQNNVPLVSPAGIESWIAQRRANLISQLQTYAPAVPFVVNNSSPVNVSGDNALTLTGTAPLNLKTIFVNGITYPVVWTGVTSWNISVPLAPGTNALLVSALDSAGNLVTNVAGAITANYTGSIPSPDGRVVFNEVMVNPTVPGAEYVELFNTDASQTFDLTGWRINGLGYTFPVGSFLSPQSYLVLAKDPFAFGTAYPGASAPFGEFGGKLDPDGETLTLFQPGPDPGEETVVDQLHYETNSPWPVPISGASLQLVDANQDNSRAGNWSINTNTAAVPSPQTLLNYSDKWRYMQTANLDGINWQSPDYDDSAWPSGPGLLADENPGVLPQPIGTALSVQFGRRTFYFRTRFTFNGPRTGLALKLSGIIDDGVIYYLNGVEIGRTGMPTGPVSYSTFSARTVGDATYEAPLIIVPSNLLTGTNVLAAEVHQHSDDSSDITFGVKLETVYNGASWNSVRATPGAENSTMDALPAFPTLWLNEVEPENLSGVTDNFGERDPWIELYNSGSNSVNLGGLYLSTNYSAPTLWAFPSDSIAPGRFMVVWTDGQTAQTSGTNLHTSFRLNPGNGSVALCRLVNGQPQNVDYLNYTDVSANHTYGDVPDGQPFYRQTMYFPTPGQSNSVALPTINVVINEWMADNQGTLLDPADNDSEDWFELYNPTSAPEDLGGYYFTDDLADMFKSQIPNNGHYIVPAHGYLLVWADNEPQQNATNRADLHAGFALSKNGEAIGLFGPDGTQIDAVVFGPQTTDVSQGRYPDGIGSLYFMPAPTPRAANVIPAPPSPPQFESIGVAGGTATFTFSIAPGTHYRVEFTADLGAPSWTTLGSDQVATKSPITIQHPVGTNQQTFYRVVELP